MNEQSYLLITINGKYWFTSINSAKRGLCDFSSGRGIIEDLTKANPWIVDIKIIDQKELDRIRKTLERII